MTDAELISFFETTNLPETLKIDRAITQRELPAYVKYYTDRLKQRPDDKNLRFWLLRIKKAIDEPFSGRPIPRF